MKCLSKFKWIMLPRKKIPNGKGIMGAWMRLASRAAYRKGKGRYCGHENAVTPGMWAGGVVGLKSILGVRRRAHAMFLLSRLEEQGYVDYDRDPKTKKLTYEIKDYVLKCTGKPSMDGTVYATAGYGFVCVPRNITERLVEKGYVFEELDAWLDLWCHTVFLDYGNAYSFLAPTIQYGKYGSVLTLETLGKRWSWEKTKVWRFFRKFEDTFALYRLPSSYGCIIYNLNYPSETEITRPDEEDVYDIGDGTMEWQVRAESSLFYRKYGSYETCADGMILICDDDKREKIAENIIRQTMWNRRTLLDEHYSETDKPVRYSRAPIKLRIQYEHVYLTTPAQLAKSLRHIYGEDNTIAYAARRGTRSRDPKLGDVEAWPIRYFVNPAYDLLKLVYFFSTVKAHLEYLKDDISSYGAELQYVIVMHREDLAILKMYPDVFQSEKVSVNVFKSKKDAEQH